MNETIYFNNCKGRRHAELFKRDDAFYDLNTDGVQAEKAIGLIPGQICVVAQKPSDEGDVRFDRYEFELESQMTDPNSGNSVRVFFGRFVSTELLQKHDAAVHPEYSILFNVNGAFKQISVKEPVSNETVTGNRG